MCIPGVSGHWSHTNAQSSTAHFLIAQVNTRAYNSVPPTCAMLIPAAGRSDITWLVGQLVIGAHVNKVSLESHVNLLIFRQYRFEILSRLRITPCSPPLLAARTVIAEISSYCGLVCLWSLLPAPLVTPLVYRRSHSYIYARRLGSSPHYIAEYCSAKFHQKLYSFNG